MNTKAMIASLALALVGFGSSAMASPGASGGSVIEDRSAKRAPGYDGPVVRDHRAADDPAYSPMYHPAPASPHDPAYSPMYNPPAAKPLPVEPPSHWRGGWVPKPQVLRPVTLASAMHFARDGRTFLSVGSHRGQFGFLTLSAATGRTFIKQVYVQFENGQEQVIRNIDFTLSGDQSLTLDLDGNRRNIKRIVVYGNELSRGWRRSAGTFTVTAS